MWNSNSRNHVNYDKCPTASDIDRCAVVRTNEVNNKVNQPLTVAAICASEVNSTATTTAITMPAAGAAPISKIFIDDLTERQKQWRIPWFLLVVSFVQISVYFIANDCVQERLMFTPEQGFQYWRYLTYMLLHSDLIHLLLNICLQCFIGFCLESEQGHWKVACIYTVGGFVGSLIPALLQPQLSLLGSSAGVYALLLSHVPHMFKNFVHLSHRYLRVVALGILFLSDIGFTAFHFLVNHNANPRICLEAHVAGGISGFVLGFLIYTSNMSSACSWCGCHSCTQKRLSLRNIY